MTKRKFSSLQYDNSSSKKQNTDINELSLPEQITEEQSNNEEEIKKWKEEGKLEGLAYGVLALFSQDAIKKPSEMIDGRYLNLPENINELSLIERVVDIYSGNTSKAIDLIMEFMRGNRTKVVANLIKDSYLNNISEYEELQYLSEELDISKNSIKKILSIENPSVDKINDILLGVDEE